MKFIYKFRAIKKYSVLRIIPAPREITLDESYVSPASVFENGGIMENKLTK